MLQQIPQILIGIRFVIAPLLLFDAADRQTTWAFVIGYAIAILTDIFDGIIARRLGVSTAKLRQADSWADICLFLSVAISTWLVHPKVILDFQVPLLFAIAAQFTLFTISIIKFRKLPSFHTYTAKTWGLTLLVATICLFGFGYAPTLWLAIALCWMNSAEEIVMTLILPTWQCDVLSVFHAITLRKMLIAAPNAKDNIA